MVKVRESLQAAADVSGGPRRVKQEAPPLRRLGDCGGRLSGRLSQRCLLWEAGGEVGAGSAGGR